MDDSLIRPLNSGQAAELLEVVEDRAQLHSTVLTSQLPVAEWHEAIGDPTIADAVLDRLLERANRIELVGESLRRGETVKSRNAK
jgi:DNA replication protein DnaC